MVFAIKALAAGAASLLVLAQAPPSGPASDRKTPDGQDTVVVTGPRTDIDLSGPKPMLHGGLWRFDRGQGLGTLSGSAGRRLTFSTCLPDDDLESTLRRTAGERSNLPRRDICGPLRLTVKDGRITGRRSCIRSKTNVGLTLSGRYDTQALTLTMTANELTDGLYEGSHVPRPSWGSWRVTASRLGECSASLAHGRRPLDEAVNLLFTPDLAASDIDGI